MKDNFDEKLGRALMKTRRAKHINQAEIAEKMSVTKMTISHWENGKRSMTAKNLKKYCEVLGVSMQYIFDLMGE